MPGSFSLAGLRILGLEEEEDEEEEVEEEDKPDPTLEGRTPPLVTAATGAVDKACPLPPLLRFRLGTGKGGVEAGLLAELCLLSGRTVEATRLESQRDDRLDWHRRLQNSQPHGESNHYYN